MAEYLCEEDMNTGEYISRDDTLLHSEIIRVYSKDYGNIDVVPVEYLADIPAADVQPISQWMSVKDRLPEPEKDVLVWYRYTWGAGFTSYRFGISKWYSNIKRWHEGCLPKDFEVLYWQPLPEPPKDGDTNE